MKHTNQEYSESADEQSSSSSGLIEDIVDSAGGGLIGGLTVTDADGESSQAQLRLAQSSEMIKILSDVTQVLGDVATVLAQWQKTQAWGIFGKKTEKYSLEVFNAGCQHISFDNAAVLGTIIGNIDCIPAETDQQIFAGALDVLRGVSNGLSELASKQLTTVIVELQSPVAEKQQGEVTTSETIASIDESLSQYHELLVLVSYYLRIKKVDIKKIGKYGESLSRVEKAIGEMKSVTTTLNDIVHAEQPVIYSTAFKSQVTRACFSHILTNMCKKIRKQYGEATQLEWHPYSIDFSSTVTSAEIDRYFATTPPVPFPMMPSIYNKELDYEEKLIYIKFSRYVDDLRRAFNSLARSSDEVICVATAEEIETLSYTCGKVQTGLEHMLKNLIKRLSAKRQNKFVNSIDAAIELASYIKHSVNAFNDASQDLLTSQEQDREDSVADNDSIASSKVTSASYDTEVPEEHSDVETSSEEGEEAMAWWQVIPQSIAALDIMLLYLEEVHLKAFTFEELHKYLSLLELTLRGEFNLQGYDRDILQNILWDSSDIGESFNKKFRDLYGNNFIVDLRQQQVLADSISSARFNSVVSDVKTIGCQAWLGDFTLENIRERFSTAYERCQLLWVDLGGLESLGDIESIDEWFSKNPPPRTGILTSNRRKIEKSLHHQKARFALRAIDNVLKLIQVFDLDLDGINGNELLQKYSDAYTNIVLLRIALYGLKKVRESAPKRMNRSDAKELLKKLDVTKGIEQQLTDSINSYFGALVPEHVLPILTEYSSESMLANLAKHGADALLQRDNNHSMQNRDMLMYILKKRFKVDGKSLEQQTASTIVAKKLSELVYLLKVTVERDPYHIGCTPSQTEISDEADNTFYTSDANDINDLLKWFDVVANGINIGADNKLTRQPGAYAARTLLLASEEGHGFIALFKQMTEHPWLQHSTSGFQMRKDGVFANMRLNDISKALPSINSVVDNEAERLNCAMPTLDDIDKYFPILEQCELNHDVNIENDSSTKSDRLHSLGQLFRAHLLLLETFENNLCCYERSADSDALVSVSWFEEQNKMWLYHKMLNESKTKCTEAWSVLEKTQNLKLLKPIWQKLDAKIDADMQLLEKKVFSLMFQHEQQQLLQPAQATKMPQNSTWLFASMWNPFRHGKKDDSAAEAVRAEMHDCDGSSIGQQRRRRRNDS